MLRVFLFCSTVFGLLTCAFAQPATEAQRAGVTNSDGFGTMHLSTRLGSFRMIDGHGRVEMTFTGTVLISRLKGKFEFSGKVHKEYEKGDRVIYSGTGKLVAVGDWRAIHWFGRDMSAVWFGSGMVRLSGEFDREQKTGEYWFEDPAKLQSWPGGSTMDIINPPVIPGVNKNIKIKKKG